MPQKAQLVSLADEVTADLNKKSGVWSMPFEAKRKWLPKPELQQTDNLTVLVAMRAQRAAQDNRSEWLWEYEIDIGVLLRAGGAAGVEPPPEKFDPLLRLTEEIAELYKSTRPTMADAQLFLVEFGGPDGQPYFPEHIQQYNQFTGVIRLTFRKWRQ